ncbi:hypothetical protein FDP41_011337 [Naegleria fowleri]|uniref:Alcohol dehydrogenase-like N-terminal domain-containing protein n=1 Tax=Naegleria fowleri TaxID=5763 RepID=A0A6A5BYN6_NAEFO|nr:uncharacterized protein FDP41_011337 [Naegleria fowleri]KAF0982407.1 hypothetical protein FDP41_011337 [Naegleria fowleri]CAG4719145.1 unnamed protein product [Naegleria fowleri]
MPDYSTQATQEIHFPSTEYKKHPSETMHALQWMGKSKVKVNVVPRPVITDPTDVIVRVTTSTICGSDLHLYFGEFEGMEKGDILGHEAVGVVEEVGPGVKNVKKGDKVVVSAVISCGQCEYCQKQQFSCCDRTNPSRAMEMMYGHRTAALFGYSHLTGAYAGGQAEFLRVPYGDQNLLVVSNPNIKDETLILLADIACTGFHATELGKVTFNDKVCIWGAGPVGLMATMWCFYRGASQVVLIDGEEYRLEKARQVFGNLNELGGIRNKSESVKEGLKNAFGFGTTGGVSSSSEEHIPKFFRKTFGGPSFTEEEYSSSTSNVKLNTINFHNWSNVDGGVVKAIQELIPGGPDVCIDCVGFRFERGFLHTLERKIGLETDSPQVLNDMIISCKKAGRLSVVGDYMGYCNHFAVGALMEKSLKWRGGQVFVQKYWKHLLKIFESGELNIDPTFVITHQVPLSQAAEAYDMFANYKDECIKVLLKPELKNVDVNI